MATIEMDPTTGDVKLRADGRVSLISGLDEIRQVLWNYLRTFRGDWFMDTRIGVPYFQSILGRKQSLPVVISLFNEAALSVPGVIRVTSLDIDFDSPTRTLTLDMSVQTQEGDLDLSFDDFVIKGGT